MATIRDLPTAWRQDLLPAHFDGRVFHVDSGTIESGRRIANHEFPKKEENYAEDMGKRATVFNVRAYFIVYPENQDDGLYQRDYRQARNRLQARLDTGGAGTLQLPTLAPMRVKCMRYVLTEE